MSEHPTRIYVLFASSFRYEQAPNISHETIDGVTTLCGRKVADAATNEPDDNNLEPDCIICRRAATKRRTDIAWMERYEVVSVTGRVWTRDMVRREAIHLSRRLGLAIDPAKVDEVLDDDRFMRVKRGMIPARVCDEVADEARLRAILIEAVR